MKKEHFEILMEDVREKLDLILEGHASLDRKIDKVHEDLNEKIEMNSFKIDALNKKIDAVARDLTAHRTDTESHGKGFKASDQ
jgi:hypothetical protein